MNHLAIMIAVYFMLCSSATAKLSITLTNINRNALPITLNIQDSMIRDTITQDLNLSNWIKVYPHASGTSKEYTLKNNCLYKNTSTQPFFCIQTQATSSPNYAHILADAIFYDATGKHAWFSSKIAMISSDIKSYKDRKYRLEVTDCHGRNTQTIFTSRTPIMSPSWSPDKKYLAYVSFEERKASIWTQNLTTGHRTKLSDAPGINGAPAWSPDQKNMALVLSKNGHAKIYLMNLTTHTTTPLTTGPSIDTEPLFHPDGKSIFYTSSIGGQPQIYQLDLASKNTKRITFYGDYNATPSISKDGSKLATLCRKDGRYMVVVHNLLTHNTSVISAQGTEEQPMIHESGEIVLFGLRHGGRMQIAMHQVDLPSRYTLPSDHGWTRFAVWSPSFDTSI